MAEITTIGLDLAKSVFQVHGIDATGRVIVAKSLRRGQLLAFFGKLPPCLVGMEACATAHHWARELMTLGHSVKLMPPAYVNSYVWRWPRTTRPMRPGSARRSRGHKCGLFQ